MSHSTGCSLANRDKPTSGYYKHRRRGEQPCRPCTELFVARVKANARRRERPTQVCEWCGEQFAADYGQRFCSRACGCRHLNESRRKVPTTAIEPLWMPAIRTPGRRWRRLPPMHPSLNGTLFVYGACRWCDDPFMALATDWERRSLYCSKRCAKYSSNHRRGRFVIPKKRRLAIYERDNWICQLCLEPVDPDSSDEWRATLDHVVPQSHQLIPDHSPSNLRLAHLWCNSVRGDESYYTADDLRPAS